MNRAGREHYSKRRQLEPKREARSTRQSVRAQANYVHHQTNSLPPVFAMGCAMTMPFGKFSGVDIGDLPDDYVRWLLTIDLRPRLRSAVEREAAYRGIEVEHEDETVGCSAAAISLHIAAVDLPLARRVFDEGYRTVAKKLHPDTGGDVAQMSALNALADSLRGQLAIGGGR